MESLRNNPFDWFSCKRSRWNIPSDWFSLLGSSRNNPFDWFSCKRSRRNNSFDWFSRVKSREKNLFSWYLDVGNLTNDVSNARTSQHFFLYRSFVAFLLELSSNIDSFQKWSYILLCNNLNPLSNQILKKITKLNDWLVIFLTIIRSNIHLFLTHKHFLPSHSEFFH